MRKSASKKAFDIFNYTFLTLLGLLCLMPFVNLFAISLSKASYVEAGYVTVYPKGFTLTSYKFVLENDKFWTSFLNSVERLAIGLPLNMIVLILTAYPLSKTNEEFAARTKFSWFFVFTMMFTGGLIPTYLVVMKMGMLNSIWSLVLPNVLSVSNMILLMNFLRSIPKEMEEAAKIDGGGIFKILVFIVLPVAKPGLATVALFRIVSHWNSWFDGMIYMKSSVNYPLQTYLRTLVVDFEAVISESVRGHGELLAMMNARTGRAAQLFIATVPIIMVYPFLSKYFTTGLVMGSVKG